MAKLPRLELVERVDLPIVEASGVAAALRAGRMRVAVVGDRTSQVAVTDHDPVSGFDDWTVIDLTTITGWPLPAGDSQLEAITVDGGSLVALMCEDPPLVLVLDVETRELRSTIALDAPPGSPLHGIWSDPSSRGEGLALLRGGRLLVAKEKHPAALVEFAPSASAPVGLRAGDLLAADEPWEAPRGDATFAAVGVWPLSGAAHERLEDVSALAVGRDGSLWLLSDKSRSVGRLVLDPPLDPAGGEISELVEVWRLPKKSKKPEGIAALDDTRVLVVLDTDSTHHNGIVVRRPRDVAPTDATRPAH
jgi:uncharacterized protein YjiK